EAADPETVIRFYDELRGHRRHSPPTSGEVYRARRYLTDALRSGEIVGLGPDEQTPRRRIIAHEPPSEAQLPPPALASSMKTTWFEVVVLDESRRPIDGIDLAVSVEGKRQRVTTNAAGRARLENQLASFGSVQLANAERVRARLRDRDPAPRKPRL